MFALDAAAARIGSLVPGLALTCILLEFADQELELIDVVIKLLRRPAKARPLELGELHLQLLDVQRLGVYLSGVGRELAVLARQFRSQIFGEKPQRVQIGRERFTYQRHGVNLSQQGSAVQHFPTQRCPVRQRPAYVATPALQSVASQWL